MYSVTGPSYHLPNQNLLDSNITSPRPEKLSEQQEPEEDNNFSHTSNEPLSSECSWFQDDPDWEDKIVANTVPLRVGDLFQGVCEAKCRPIQIPGAPSTVQNTINIGQDWVTKEAIKTLPGGRVINEMRKVYGNEDTTKNADTIARIVGDQVKSSVENIPFVGQSIIEFGENLKSPGTKSLAETCALVFIPGADVDIAEGHPSDVAGGVLKKVVDSALPFGIGKAITKKTGELGMQYFGTKTLFSGLTQSLYGASQWLASGPGYSDEEDSNTNSLSERESSSDEAY